MKNSPPRHSSRANAIRSLGLSLAFAISFGLGCAPEETTPMNEPARPDDALSQAFDELVSTLRAVEADIRRSPSFGDEAEQVGA